MDNCTTLGVPVLPEVQIAKATSVFIFWLAGEIELRSSVSNDI